MDAEFPAGLRLSTPPWAHATPCDRACGRPDLIWQSSVRVIITSYVSLIDELPPHVRVHTSGLSHVCASHVRVHACARVCVHACAGGMACVRVRAGRRVCVCECVCARAYVCAHVLVLAGAGLLSRAVARMGVKPSVLHEGRGLSTPCRASDPLLSSRCGMFPSGVYRVAGSPPSTPRVFTQSRPCGDQDARWPILAELMMSADCSGLRPG